MKALDFKTEAKLNNIDRALQSTLVSHGVVTVIKLPALLYSAAEWEFDFVMQFYQQKQKVFKLVEFPLKCLFKPNKHYVAELEKKDYLGKAKVNTWPTCMTQMLLYERH